MLIESHSHVKLAKLLNTIACFCFLLYTRGIKAVAVFLYSEGGVANDRICTFLNSLSGGSLDISEGSIYHFCKDFSIYQSIMSLMAGEPVIL